MIKKIGKILSVFLLISSLFSFSFVGLCNGAPNYHKDFKDNIEGESNGTYDVEGIERDSSIRENIKGIFYPGKDGSIRVLIRVVGVGVFVLYTLWVGVNFILNADEESERKKAQKSLLYLGYGAFLFFGASWLIGTVVNVPNVGGAEGLVENTTDNLFFQIFRVLKGGAFFFAIIMLIYYGYRMMQAQEKEDKIKSARKGVLNVALGLIFMKVIEYVYYIASQPDLKTKAGKLIVRISKGLGWTIGVLMVLVIFYAGLKLVTSRGDEESFKKSKKMIISVFVVGLLIMLFMLIIYQAVGDLAG